MPIRITVPRLGWSMEEGTFSEWLKHDGDSVVAGDLLFVLESDKASQEVESLDSGVLHIPTDAPKPGDKVIVGQLLGYLLAEGESIPVADLPAAATPTPPGTPSAPPVVAPMSVSSAQRERGRRPSSVREPDAWRLNSVWIGWVSRARDGTGAFARLTFVTQPRRRSPRASRPRAGRLPSALLPANRKPLR